MAVKENAQKSTDQRPSSPEDGEITDEDISLDENCVEVRLTITILKYSLFILITCTLFINLHISILFIFLIFYTTLI